MKHQNRRVFGIAAVAGALAFTASAASADRFNFRIGAGHPATLPYVSELESFFVPEVVRRIEAETDHTANFVEAYGGSVAALPEIFEATESGLLDFGAMATTFEPSALYLNNYGFQTPFGIGDPVRAGAIARELYDTFPALPGQVEAHGQVPLAVMASSNYNIITTEPWATLEDLEGRRIMAGGPNLAWLDATDATPVQGSLGDAYNGMQTGVFDGMLIHYQGMAGFNLHEVAPYIARIDFGSMPINLLNVNADRWESLPEEVRTIVTEVALEYEARVNEANAARDETAVQTMVDAGATLLEIASDVRAAWAAGAVDIPRNAAAEGAERGLPSAEVIGAYIEALISEGSEVAGTYALN
ncbi:C4-dicarboxylate TRAP transporter substrate-binding protein [Roseobacter sp. YSTF-M11]|uniref:C4-dicarboxylate TRAP transporter substrate-binding protein n=1 Tax=Roseobacter insulae TaxID=2859783 RepID=A0A9X1FYQ8_9RHOB|nr:C4-dicarboxylate TRAP transporter substrate-binding protein [Roseobacter insulae]MBW4709817.1 C4-dicarboxylate TRAP transporter substrate-binding protein [Roseobacter insulae]